MIRVQGAISERRNELASGAACISARECSDLCTLARGGRRDMALCFTLYFLSHSGRRPRHGVDRCALRPLLFSHPTCAQLMFALTATLTAPFAAHRLTLLKPHMLVLLARARRPMFSYIFLRFSMLLGSDYKQRRLFTGKSLQCLRACSPGKIERIARFCARSRCMGYVGSAGRDRVPDQAEGVSDGICIYCHNKVRKSQSTLTGSP